MLICPIHLHSLHFLSFYIENVLSSICFPFVCFHVSLVFLDFLFFHCGGSRPKSQTCFQLGREDTTSSNVKLQGDGKKKYGLRALIGRLLFFINGRIFSGHRFPGKK